MFNRLATFVAASLVSFAAQGQATVYFRISISAPVGQAAPSAVVEAPPPSLPLADRTALRTMWDGMAFQVTPIARDCAMPIAVSIDAASFTGHYASSADGLEPGTRSRFRDLARAATAVCHRGPTEQAAMRSRVHGLRFGYTSSPTDTVAVQGDTLVIYTNGDMSGPGHLGYAQMIDKITHSI